MSNREGDGSVELLRLWTLYEVSTKGSITCEPRGYPDYKECPHLGYQSMKEEAISLISPGVYYTGNGTKINSMFVFTPPLPSAQVSGVSCRIYTPYTSTSQKCVHLIHN